MPAALAVSTSPQQARQDWRVRAEPPEALPFARNATVGSAPALLRKRRPSSRARNQWRTAGICLLDLADVDRDLADWSG